MHSRNKRERCKPEMLGVYGRLYVDAAYGVHGDGKSHTVGAVHCKSSKQSKVTKSGTEAELIALSESANQGLYIRNFLIGQGHGMGPGTVYQDNTSCMALVERGRERATYPADTSGCGSGLREKRPPWCIRGRRKCTRTS